MSSQIAGKYTRLRTAVFISSWLCYAGYYLCRQDVSAVKSFGGGKASLGEVTWTMCCFGLSYTLGHLTAGSIADKRGGRLPALIGGLISAVSTMAMVLTGSTRIFVLLQLVNGFGQGFGFPSLAKILAGWFRRPERANVFGWWTGSYSIGSVLAASFTLWCASTTSLFPELGWRRSFCGHLYYSRPFRSIFTSPHRMHQKRQAYSHFMRCRTVRSRHRGGGLCC